MHEQSDVKTRDSQDLWGK